MKGLQRNRRADKPDQSGPYDRGGLAGHIATAKPAGWDGQNMLSHTCSPPRGGWSPSPSPDLKTPSWSTLSHPPSKQQRQHTCKGASLACQRAWYNPDLTLIAGPGRNVLSGMLVEGFSFSTGGVSPFFRLCPHNQKQCAYAYDGCAHGSLSPSLDHPQNAKRHL